MLGAQLMPGLLEWAVETYSAQRIAVIHWNDAAGRAIKESVDAYCATAGCEVVVSEPHEVDERNYSPMLARISASNADMLVIGSWGNDVGYILDQARRQGLQIPAIGNEWTPDAQEIGGAAMEEYVAILDNFDADNPANDASARFISAHRTTYGEDPEFYGANYYELVKMVIPELVRLAVAQGLDPSERGVLMDVMAAAVAAGTPFESLYGGSMTFNDNGTIQKPAGAYRVSGGTLGRFGLLQAGSIVEG
jgi:branched-chain amino acid transport system substrate-binding protein